MTNIAQMPELLIRLEMHSKVVATNLFLFQYLLPSEYLCPMVQGGAFRLA